MAQLILKGSKFIADYRFVRSTGYRFRWVAARSRAQRFDDNDPMAEVFARLTHSRRVQVPESPPSRVRGSVRKVRDSRGYQLRIGCARLQR